MGGLRSIRLWTTGNSSAPKRTKEKKKKNKTKDLPYPDEILIDKAEAKRHRRLPKREELNYWKERAAYLEENVAELEGRVAELEAELLASEMDRRKDPRAKAATAEGDPDILRSEGGEGIAIIPSFDGSAGPNRPPRGRAAARTDTSTPEGLPARAPVAERVGGAADPGNVYRLTCTNCVGQHFVGRAQGNLSKRVGGNFADVWHVVCTAYGRGEGRDGDGVGEGMFCEPRSPFRASSLAHHLAGHCRDCKSEKEVYAWCYDNVRVERICRNPTMMRRSNTA